MSKLKININKSDPSKETIRKYKKYDSLIDTYHKVHSTHGLRELWYKDKRLLALIVTMVMLFLMMLFEGEFDEEQPHDSQDNSKIEQVMPDKTDKNLE